VAHALPGEGCLPADVESGCLARQKSKAGPEFEVVVWKLERAAAESVQPPIADIVRGEGGRNADLLERRGAQWSTARQPGEGFDAILWIRLSQASSIYISIVTMSSYFAIDEIRLNVITE
jgi:hypothetical protein